MECDSYVTATRFIHALIYMLLKIYFLTFEVHLNKNGIEIANLIYNSIVLVLKRQ